LPEHILKKINLGIESRSPSLLVKGGAVKSLAKRSTEDPRPTHSEIFYSGADGFLAVVTGMFARAQYIPLNYLTIFTDRNPFGGFRLYFFRTHKLKGSIHE
jgi:hypothetical protein